MSEFTVEIRDLDEMTVVSALGFGKEPELEAWDSIARFADEMGINVTDGSHRFFGFNNPHPSPGSPEYGYEQWITIDPSIEVKEPLVKKVIPAGRYAVTRFRGLQHITDSWRNLFGWFEESRLGPGPATDESLEELRSPISLPVEEWEFDLYLPVAANA